MKILVIGSCVSRDSLEYLKKEEYELVAYYARNSFATLTSKTVPDSFFESLKNIPSSFQKRMVECDFNHTMLQAICNKEFDILLIDLIDERFHLAVLQREFRVTRSNEFLKSGIQPTSLINTHSSEYMNFWEKGVDLLCSILLDKDLLHKVRLQKAYWTNVIDIGGFANEYSNELIKKENDKLNFMYEYFEKYLSPGQFIVLPEQYYKIKSDHKWGISPFHYIDDYYKYLVDKIV